jgi:hypothetical protein
MLLRWILHLLGIDDAPDPAWRPTGYRARFTGHDEAGAVAAVKQSEARAAARRKIAARRSVPRTATCVHCLRWQRKAAPVEARAHGICWDQVPAVFRSEDDSCGAFVDQLANRDEVEAWPRRP